jgi:glycine cleavage system H protein
VEINPDLDLSPEIINQEPYGKGWLAVIETTNWQADRGQLLDANAYLAAMRRQAEEELTKQ